MFSRRNQNLIKKVGNCVRNQTLKVNVLKFKYFYERKKYVLQITRIRAEEWIKLFISMASSTLQQTHTHSHTHTYTHTHTHGINSSSGKWESVPKPEKVWESVLKVQKVCQNMRK